MKSDAFTVIWSNKNMLSRTSSIMPLELDALVWIQHF